MIKVILKLMGLVISVVLLIIVVGLIILGLYQHWAYRGSETVQPKKASVDDSWIVPFKGTIQAKEDAYSYIKRAYAYEDVHNAPFCIFLYDDLNYFRVRNIHCVATFVDGYGLERCNMFSINMFNDEMWNSPDGFVGYGKCNSESFSGKKVALLYVLLSDCIQHVHKGAQSHGCYLLKDDLHYWKSEYKKKLGY